MPGTIHWVSAADAVDAEIRLYDHLFANPDPDDVPEGVDWITTVHPGSLEVVDGAKVEGNIIPVIAGKKNVKVEIVLEG